MIKVPQCWQHKWKKKKKKKKLKCPSRPHRASVGRECKMTSKSWQFGRHPVNWRVAGRAWERQKTDYVLCVYVGVCLTDSQPKRKKGEEWPTTRPSPSFNQLETLVHSFAVLYLHTCSGLPSRQRTTLLITTVSVAALLIIDFSVSLLTE